MKRTLILALLCLLPIAARAQVGPIVITATSSPCATIAVGTKGSQVAITVVGTFSGTLQPELSLQGQAAANTQVTPSTSSTAQSTITAAGTFFTVNVAGADTFLLCPTTFASGTATVYLNISTASSKGGGGGGGGSGTVTSVATTSPIGGGTITGTGTLTCTTCLTATTPTAHGVTLGAGSQALGVTAAGTTGQVLTGVTGSDPTFQAATVPTSGVGAPGMILLEEHTAASSATLDFTTCISSTYDEYLITLTSLVNATNTQDLQMLVGTGGTPTYQASAYEYVAWNNNTANTGFGSSNSTSASTIQLFPTQDNASTYGANARISVHDPQNATLFKSVDFTISDQFQPSVHQYRQDGSAWWDGATALTAVRIKYASGNITSGTARCYGLTK